MLGHLGLEVRNQSVDDKARKSTSGLQDSTNILCREELPAPASLNTCNYVNKGERLKKSQDITVHWNNSCSNKHEVNVG